MVRRQGRTAGPGWAGAPPSPLLAVPNVTAHPSTASVPTSYYSMWQLLPLHSKEWNVLQGSQIFINYLLPCCLCLSVVLLKLNIRLVWSDSFIHQSFYRFPVKLQWCTHRKQSWPKTSYIDFPFHSSVISVIVSRSVTDTRWQIGGRRRVMAVKRLSIARA